jgi:hypothetical protein
MRRRDLIAGVAGSAAVWPLAARAQQSGMRRIGFLGAATLSVASQWVAAFVQRLQELGWIENQNLTIEYRWAEGRSERFAEIANEFVRIKVDVIMTWSGGPVIAAKQATAGIPIGPGWYRTGGQSVASRRQCDRLVGPADRHCRQEARIVARDCSGSRPISDHGQRRRSRRPTRNGRVGSSSASA